jgi:hydrogenase nickel incorporation protein HypB
LRVNLSADILADNEEIAAGTREWLRDLGVLCVGLLSSPGAGKTALLEATARLWTGPGNLQAIVGDVATAADAERLARCGIPAVQINTEHHGAACHLGAPAVARALDALELARGDTLFVENVGNLVCPVGFRLGEHFRVVLLSVAEGGDKPLKYPRAVLDTDLALVTKVDLAPHVDVSAEEIAAAIRRVRPSAEVLAVSVRTGEGLEEWLSWLRGRAADARGGSP